MAKGAKKVDLQVRGVPIDLRRKLAKRAASRGLSMSRYVISIIEDDVDRPATVDEWLEQLSERRGPPRELGFDPADLVREVRDAVDRGEEP